MGSRLSSRVPFGRMLLSIYLALAMSIGCAAESPAADDLVLDVPGVERADGTFSDGSIRLGVRSDGATTSVLMNVEDSNGELAQAYEFAAVGDQLRVRLSKRAGAQNGAQNAEEFILSQDGEVIDGPTGEQGGVDRLDALLDSGTIEAADSLGIATDILECRRPLAGNQDGIWWTAVGCGWAVVASLSAYRSARRGDFVSTYRQVPNAVNGVGSIVGCVVSIRGLVLHKQDPATMYCESPAQPSFASVKRTIDTAARTDVVDGTLSIVSRGVGIPGTVQNDQVSVYVRLLAGEKLIGGEWIVLGGTLGTSVPFHINVPPGNSGPLSVGLKAPWIARITSPVAETR